MFQPHDLIFQVKGNGEKFSTEEINLNSPSQSLVMVDLEANGISLDSDFKLDVAMYTITRK